MSSTKKSLSKILFSVKSYLKIARLAGDLTEFENFRNWSRLGGLTRGLLSRCSKIVAIEKDKDAFGFEEIQTHYPGRLKITEGDASLIRLDKYFTKPVKFCQSSI